MAKKNKGFLGKLRGLALGSVAKNAMSTVNARVKKWQSEGVPEETINDYLGLAAKIEGITLKDGKLVIEKDLDIYAAASLKSSIPIFKEFKKAEAAITKEVGELVAEDKAVAEQLRAELLWDAEIKRLSDKALDELWDTWYSDHSTKERNTSIQTMDAFIRKDLSDKMTIMGKNIRRGVGKAVSVEEIYELISEIEEATGGSAK